MAKLTFTAVDSDGNAEDDVVEQFHCPFPAWVTAWHRFNDAFMEDMLVTQSKAPDIRDGVLALLSHNWDRDGVVVMTMEGGTITVIVESEEGDCIQHHDPIAPDDLSELAVPAEG